MTTEHIAVVLLVLVALLWLRSSGAERRRGPRSLSALQRQRRDSATPFRATSIRPSRHPCQAVQQLRHRRFLDAEGQTPVLPLAQCDADPCRCRYRRHNDRRVSLEDRRFPDDALARLYVAEGGVDRRRTRVDRRRAVRQ